MKYNHGIHPNGINEYVTFMKLSDSQIQSTGMDPNKKMRTE